MQFRQAIESSPEYVQARVNLALILAGRKEYPEARRQLSAAIALEPKNIKALTALGMIQEQTGDELAIESFRKVVELDPNVPESHLNLGIALPICIEALRWWVFHGRGLIAEERRSALQQRPGSE